MNTYPVPEYVSALVDYLIFEMGRNYRPEISVYSQWFTTEDKDRYTPTLCFNGIKLVWTNYPAKQLDSNVSLSAGGWIDWFESALQEIREVKVTTHE